MKKIDQAVQHQVESVSLSDEQCDALLKMQQGVLAEPQPVPAPAKHAPAAWLRWAIPSVSIAVCAVLVLLFGALTPPIEQRIAKEVVKNHLKLKPLDVASNSLPAVRRYFTQLDFAVVQAKQPLLLAATKPEPRLLGGRYCSIQGVTAAQLRYAHPHGVTTLYQVAYDERVFGPMASRTNMVLDGVHVSMWLEQGVLLVSVSTP